MVWTNRLVESIPGLLKRLQIRALGILPYIFLSVSCNSITVIKKEGGGGGGEGGRVMIGRQKNVLSPPPSSSSSSQERLFKNCNGKVIFLSFLFTLLSMQRHCAKRSGQNPLLAGSIQLLTDRKTNHKVMQVFLATCLKKFVRRVSSIPASNIFCCLEKKICFSLFGKIMVDEKDVFNHLCMMYLWKREV
jgi:hypothetical protein